MIQSDHALPVAQVRALLWDLDGTLVDSRADITSSLNAALAGQGLDPLPLETVMGFVGHGARDLVRGCLAGRGDEDEAYGAFLDHYRANLVVVTRPYPGIPEVLAAARARGLRQAVLTNKPIEHTEGILAGLGLRGFFEVVVGGDSLPIRKPDPEGARAILGALGLRPESAVMVGDSDTDTRTARAAGLWSLGVAYGISPGSLADPRPDLCVDSAAALAEALGL